ncbi:MAG: hypothetical protein JSS46_03300 [Proteobacteria bacterium]|jgi:hypothetical protein|nr:hypothetical protein [Pseudomonadota bacterium]
MSFHIRPRSNNRAHELRIKHPLLPRPFYATFDSAAEARAFAEKASHRSAGNTVLS